MSSQKQNRIIIVGAGASVRQGQWHRPARELALWEKIKNEPTIALNYTHRYFEPTFTCFHDECFYLSNLAELDTLPLIIGKHSVNTEEVVLPNTYLVKNSMTFHTDQWNKGFYGSNLCGVLALSMAINFGYKQIYLLGYDFGSKTSLTHFYQDELDMEEKDWMNQPKYRGVGLKEVDGKKVPKTGNYIFDSANYFGPFHHYKNDVEIINVGEESNIKEFYKASYAEFYSDLELFPSNVRQIEERRDIELTIVEKKNK